MSLAESRIAPLRPRRTTTLRARLEAAIEHALTALDDMDGDVEAEPTLGAPESRCGLFARSGCRPGDQRVWADGGDADEREDVSEDEGGACEDEGAAVGC